MTPLSRTREGRLFTVVFLRFASASCKTAQFSETCRRNASFRNTATLLRMRPRYQRGRTMTKVGFPTTVAEAAQYIELATLLTCEDSRAEMLLRYWHAGYHTTKELMPWRDFPVTR
jgi:hypothetical protein